MKRKLLVLLAVLALAGAALAEARYTLPDGIDEMDEPMDGELYWHALPECGGVPRPAMSGDERRWPCPVCAPDACDYPGLEIYGLGGLTVIRMSDEFIATREDVGGVFGFSGTTEYQGAEAEALLSRLLHGADYADFRANWTGNGAASATIRCASSLMTPSGDFDRSCIGAPRHLGAAWVEVFPPMTRADDALNPRFFEGTLTATGDGLSCVTPEEWNLYLDGASVEALEAEPACHYEGQIRSVRGGDWTLEVYRARGLNLAVLRLSGGDAMFKPDISLDASGWPERVTMTDPYWDGETALYGCALTDGEAEALIAGGPFVDYANMAQIGPDFGNTEYGMGITDGWNYYVEDRDGNVLLSPVYGHMERTGSVFLAMEWLPDSLGDSRSIVYDAAGDRVLMAADNMILTLNPFEGGFFMHEYNKTTLTLASGDAPSGVEWTELREHGVVSAQDPDVWRQAETWAEAGTPPSVRLAGRKGYKNTTAITLWGDPDVYVAPYAKKLRTFFDYDGGQPQVPEGTLLGCVCVDDQNCAFIVWSLDGGEKPSAEELGLTCAGRPLRRLEGDALSVNRKAARRHWRNLVRDGLRQIGAGWAVDLYHLARPFLR